jgi:chromosome segregation ATPase
MYRTTDTVREHRNEIRELEGKNKELEGKNQQLEEANKQHEQRLLVIEQNFANVKASADDLIGELKTVNQSSKEMSEMMGVMVDRYQDAQAKIRSLEADNSSLATQILDAFEKATLKARFDLLKEYKQGLLVEAEVDAELELLEDVLDEAGCSSAAPAEVAVPTSNEQQPVEAEPPVEAAPEEGHEMPK